MPIIPGSVDPMQEESAERRRKKEQALATLNSLAGRGISLKRHVFFVPGWAGEEGKAWKEPYPKLLKGHGPIKYWIDRIVRNPDRVTYVSYVDFLLQESKNSRSFLDFGELLKARVKSKIAASQEPVDLIGHSMGGLDILAAITQGEDALTSVENCVTVASPLQGVAYGRFIDELDKLLPFLKWQPFHQIQVENMDKHCKAIQQINLLDNRCKLLERVKAFYQLEGTQDATVMRNARLKTDGLPEALRKTITHLIIGGASHSGATGITQDPRTVLYLISVVADIPIEKPKLNYGYVYVRKG